MYTADVSSSQRWDQTIAPPQIVPLNYNNKKGPDSSICRRRVSVRPSVRPSAKNATL